MDGEGKNARGSHAISVLPLRTAKLRLIRISPRQNPPQWNCLSMGIAKRDFPANLPRTSACSYENVVFGVYACYKKANDLQGQRRVLELLSTQAREPGLRDLALLRLAGLKAEEGNMRDAMDIVRRTDARGEFANARAKLIKTWQEQLKNKSKR